MSSVNKVILIGNCGRDPELRYTPAGTATTQLSVATSFRRRAKENQEASEETEWHRVVLFERLAEVAAQYVRKGKPVYIEGRLKTREWNDKDSVKRHTTEIIASDLKLLGGRDAEDKPAPPRPAPAAQKQAAGFDDMDNEIPF